MTSPMHGGYEIDLDGAIEIGGKGDVCYGTSKLTLGFSPLTFSV